MTNEEIKALDFEALEKRSAEIAEETSEADAEQLEALNAELDAIEERRHTLELEIETRKKAEAAVISGEGEVVETEERKSDMEIEVRNTPEYIDAYAKYIKTGKPEECRSLLSENATGGTVAVPELVYDIVKTAWDKEGIMSLVKKSYMKGNLKVGFEISGTDAAAHTEGSAAVSEETLVTGIVNLVPVSIKKWVSISDEALDLSGEAFLRYIYDELAYRIAKKAADELVAGIIACPVTATTTCPSVPVVTATTISVGIVAQAMGELSDEAANPVVIMNKATWSAFKAAQYAGNFDVDPFEGLPVVFNNSIDSFAAATSGETYAIVGDLGQGALANFPNGEEINFKFDDMTLATSDLVRVIGRQFVGIGVVANDAFVKLVK